MDIITEAKEERLNDLNNLSEAIKKTDEYCKKSSHCMSSSNYYISPEGEMILKNQITTMKILYNMAAKIEKMGI